MNYENWRRAFRRDPRVPYTGAPLAESCPLDVPDHEDRDRIFRECWREFVRAGACDADLAVGDGVERPGE